MDIDEIIWEEKRDIATLVSLGAINRAPTRLRARIDPTRLQARLIPRAPQARSIDPTRRQARIDPTRGSA